MSRKHKDYSVDGVIRDLNKRQGCRVTPNPVGGIIEIDKKNHDLGNKSKGKIDFLVNYHNFVISSQGSNTHH